MIASIASLCAPSTSFWRFLSISESDFWIVLNAFPVDCGVFEGCKVVRGAIADVTAPRILSNNDGFAEDWADAEGAFVAGEGEFAKGEFVIGEFVEPVVEVFEARAFVSGGSAPEVSEAGL